MCSVSLVVFCLKVVLNVDGFVFPVLGLVVVVVPFAARLAVVRV